MLLLFRIMISIMAIGTSVNGHVLKKSDKLFVDIFTGYEKDVRPRCGVNNTVRVVMDLALRQIIELDEPQQILYTNCWLRITWSDCRLTWNSSVYGVDNLVLPATKLWYPDLTLYDSSGEAASKHIKDYRLMVTANSNVKQYLPVILVSLCNIDVSVFPFDEQICNLTFGMWMHDGLDVDITPLRDADLSKYIQHEEWKLISFKSQRVVNSFEDIPYPIAVYQLKLRRKPLFYIINLLFPCVLISTIALLGFVLPSESGEKVNLEVTVLLSLAVFQLIVLDTMPPSSETLPVIGLYFAATMVMVALSCLMTVLVLNIHFRGKTDFRAPRIMRCIIIDGLGKLFCIQSTHDRQEDDSSVYKPSDRKESGFGNGHAGIFQIDIPSRKPKNNNHMDQSDTHTLQMELTAGRYSELIKIHEKMLETLKFIGNKLCESSENIRNTDEWYLMAIILDRFFLLIFLFISVALLFVFMLRYLI